MIPPLSGTSKFITDEDEIHQQIIKIMHHYFYDKGEGGRC